VTSNPSDPPGPSDAAVIPVRPGDELDAPALERYLRSAELGLALPAEPMVVRQFATGRANLTYLVSFGGTRLVVRRPPRGTLAPGSHDMAREHNVLSRLGAAYPPAPLARHLCDDPTVIGAPFVVIDYREGVVIEDEVPPSMAHHPDVGRRVSLALVDAAAGLHTVDADAAGLSGLGRPDGYGARQVAGWGDRWNRVSGPDDAASPAMTSVAGELARTVPAPSRVSVVHNYLKLDNCQFVPADPDRVHSVFDWDMATLGDPLFDVGSLLVAMTSNPVWGLSTDEALARYGERSGIDVTGIGWYLAFATWRTAVVVQQLYNRYRSGDSTDDRLAGMGEVVPTLADRAAALLTQN
jgi:aminoglycoside phosphotransferase (APT) family kinase protein